jgi:hypothetical protein
MNLNIGERQSDAEAASTAGEPKANRSMEVTA